MWCDIRLYHVCATQRHGSSVAGVAEHIVDIISYHESGDIILYHVCATHLHESGDISVYHVCSTHLHESGGGDMIDVLVARHHQRIQSDKLQS